MHLCRMSRCVDRNVRIANPEETPERYLDELEAVIVEEGATLVVPVSEETLRVAALRDRLPHTVEIFSTGQATLLELHDKYRFAKRAAALGLGAPQSFLPEDANSIADTMPLIAKPRHACSGRGVRRLRSGSRPALDELSPGDLIQQRIDGSEVSSFAICRSGRILALVVYEARILSGSVAVCFRSIATPPAVKRWVERFAEAVAYTGFLAFDFIIDSKERAFAIECNPRATSGIHFIPAGVLSGLITQETREPAAFEHGNTLSESWSCLTVLLGKVLEPAAFRSLFTELRRARDVSFSRRDPWPFLLMPVNTAPILWRSIRRRSTFAEVAVSDLEWRETEPLQTGPRQAAPGESGAQ